jgi:zinc transport system permease protein
MPEILQYDFMVRALIAGLLVAAVMPVLGSFLVARRYSLIADSLAHSSLAGVGLGLVLSASPILVAVPVTAIGAIFLEWLRQKQRISGEVGLAILMSGGLALAVVLANLAHGANANFDSYLFGSITTTSVSDIIVLAVVGAVILGVIILNYRALLHAAFDEDSAFIAGYKVSWLSYVLAVMAAVMVVLSLRIVGGLLISALLVIPVISASQIASSFFQTIIWAIVIALASVLIGLIAAFYLGVAAGGAIVLAALLIFIITMLFRR